MKTIELFQNKQLWLLKEQKKPGELRTGIERVLLHQSATFHQGDERFDPVRRNAQCTAVSTIAIVALSLSESSVTRKLMDQILIEGDRFYADCKLTNNLSYSHLSPEDLLTSFTACGHKVTITVEPSGEGFFSSGNAPKEIEEVIRTEALEEEAQLARRGFLFIAGSKTAAFFICPPVSQSTRHNSFLCNPHCVDNNNRYPQKKPSQGKARLFRCLSAQALITLLLADRHGNIGAWQIYRIKVFQLYIQILLVNL